MMTRTSRIRLLSAVAVAGSLALVPAGRVIAQDTVPSSGGRQFGPGPGGRGPMGPAGQGGLALERLTGELALTDQQKSAIEALLSSQRTALTAQMESLRQARLALDDAVLRVPTDDGLLQAQAQQLSTLEAGLTLARAQTEAKIFQLLRGDQQAKARQLLADLQQRGGRRGGKG